MKTIYRIWLVLIRAIWSKTTLRIFTITLKDDRQRRPLLVRSTHQSVRKIYCQFSCQTHEIKWCRKGTKSVCSGQITFTRFQVQVSQHSYSWCNKWHKVRHFLNSRYLSWCSPQNKKWSKESNQFFPLPISSQYVWAKNKIFCGITNFLLHSGIPQRT